jgi:hypothetical protein
MRSILTATTGAMIAGAALLVAACGGGAANNTANAPVADPGNTGTEMPANEGMPVDNTMPPATDGNTMPPATDGNMAGNTTNNM